MAQEATDKNGNTLEDYPTFESHDRMVLIGLIDGKAEYYDPSHHQVESHLMADDGGFDYTQITGLDDDYTIGEHIRDTEEEFMAYDQLTAGAKFLRNAAPVEGTKVITDRQAFAYAFRELESVPRGEVAIMLDISPNTLDNVLATAKKKVEAAKNVAEATE